MKKNVALFLTLLGAAGLIFGVVTIFKADPMEANAWIGIILGGIFFSSGISLLRTTKSHQERV